MGTDDTNKPGAPTGEPHEDPETAAGDDRPTAEQTPAGEHSEQWLANARQAGEKIKGIFKH
jgi:hypothetical protein